MITFVKVDQCFLVFNSGFCSFFVVYCLWYFSAKNPFLFLDNNEH